MDGADFTVAVLAAAGGAVVALLVVATVVMLRRRNRSRADLEALLAAAQRESDDLRARLEELTVLLGPAAPTASGASAVETAAYLITDAGTASREVSAEDQVAVPDRLVLSATVGAPLVKVAAFGHGVRRALSPESRNRIWFEMRREVRTARKRRRRQVREHLRQVRADERAQEGLA
ncbi:MAG TPA: hypothetical protein VFE15_14555 [Marmoricola sp.]|jgi:hypothetical protein|nr:hypothetical protein [Marmoricola sp.]